MGGRWTVYVQMHLKSVILTKSWNLLKLQLKLKIKNTAWNDCDTVVSADTQIYIYI